LPIRKVLTWDAAQQPWDPEYEKKTVGIPLSYVIKNDKGLEAGRAHPAARQGPHFHEDEGAAGERGMRSRARAWPFTGEDWAQLTPVDREMKLFIGQSRDVKGDPAEDEG
jgi:hypothetical protein